MDEKAGDQRKKPLVLEITKGFDKILAWLIRRVRRVHAFHVQHEQFLGDQWFSSPL